MPIEFETEDKLQYNFVPNSSGFIQFRVRAANDAHISLTTSAAECEPMYEIFIGGWGNSRSVIRKNRQKPDAAEAPTPGILSPNEYRGFWVRWQNGEITVGREGDRAFLGWNDNENIPISYVGFCTGWGSTGSWIIEEAGGGMPPRFGGGAPASFTAGGGGGCYGGSGGGTCWVAATGGQVPPRAFQGGEDNGEPLYVIRGNFSGALIPGKLVPSHGVAYIPWGGKENAVSNYEVLCDCNAQWIACSGGNIPPNAVTAGQSEDGEPLYVGRTVHDGTLTIGKVQPSHGCLYIPYGGEEVSYREYEILVQ